MATPLPKEVCIVEVGPRDGLQNESVSAPAETKLRFIELLVQSGLTQIEATAFVSPKAIPQLADADDVARRLPRKAGVTFSALAPNAKGLARAAEAGIRRIAVFTGATESFTQRNINMSIEQSLEGFGQVVREAAAQGISARGYLSVCFECPFEGRVAKERVRELTVKLLDLGVNQVAISDTLGTAAPIEVMETVGFVLEKVPADMIALHLHDTTGTALANVFAGLQLGIETFDASTGGLGGCPYAPGAAGNLATEDLVYMLERMGIDTGVDRAKLLEAGDVIELALGRSLPSRQRRRRAGSCPS